VLPIKQLFSVDLYIFWSKLAHIMHNKIFINRRKGADRREDDDPCKGLDVDLYHRKRRKKTERREERSLGEDYYAFMSSKDSFDDKSEPPQH